MCDFMSLFQKRHSCRGYSDKPVEREKLTNCVEAARLAPSACNSQPWSFIVVDNPEVVAKLAKAGQPLPNSKVNAHLPQAKAFIVVIEEFAVLMPRVAALLDSQHFAAGDLGIATAHISLAAAAQGLGCCHIGLFDRNEVRAALGLSQEARINLMISFGYPASDEIPPKDRKPLGEIVRYV